MLREAFFRVRRFDEFQRRLEISRSVLSRTLKSLIAQGLLERRLYQRRPDRYEYLLTESGRDLYPVFLAMKAWGDKWLGSDGPDITLIHKLCGHESRPELKCDRCNVTVKALDMTFSVQEVRRAT